MSTIAEQALRTAGWTDEILPPGPTGEHGTRIVGADGSTIALWQGSREWSAQIYVHDTEDGFVGWRVSGDLEKVAAAAVTRGRQQSALHLYDESMNRIGLATDEQIEAAETTDGGWIWLDPDDRPVSVTEYDEDTVTIDYGPIGGGGHGVGETRSREGYRQVCVA
ncbi:hypothetical protein [Glutamicibacter sp. V16R2B1]|uniref:hypothetical protein n=1 Tax=Glutamicibacter sp. V16R2B1 TaxID=2036207 RepID=UPI0010FF575E|nr:hypothetical protein [Glutamicibacter sp. V16R2B1]MCK9901300.1 hypothetical protein [Frankia sp. Cpl3]TLK47989.1 hypothetical protein FDN03_15495 [Glutamicibacter sp. V16R2B1]